MTIPREEMLRSTVGVPENVARRSFSNEMVVLNLTTGQYHGLNTTAGRMLDVLEEQPSVGDALTVLDAEFDAPSDQIQTDVLEFCTALLERGLIDLRPAAA